MTGHRGERVAHRIQEIVARLLREEVRDPRIGFVTLTGVELSKDRHVAKVFVAAHGSEGERQRALGGLNNAAPFLRRAVGRELSLRFTPEIVFEEDAGFEHGFRVESILRELHEEDEGPEGGE
jgi:ribosome-binding factor A